MRRPALLLALVTAAVSTTAVLAPSSSAATAKRPVLFVHGWNSSQATWDTAVASFKAAGYVDAELHRWSYDTSQSNTITAQDIATRVDSIRASTGWDKVDIVAHSMGSLSSRHYLKELGGDLRVDDWVSMGGPNHGTDTANFCAQTSCREMRIGSSFLTALNSGDESPGTPTYSTWWSPCDTVINPDSSVPVAGATNTKTACISHGALITDSTVLGQVRARVDD